MGHKIHPWVVGTILIGFFLLFFLLFRGTQYAKSKLAENAVLKEAVDSLVKKQVLDSLASKEEAQRHNTSLEYANGVIALRENQRDAYRIALEASNEKVDALLKRYKPVQTSTDTSITTVPNEYISDCAECFDQLDFKHRTIKLYIELSDSLELAIKTKDSINTARISRVETERDVYQQTAREAIALAAQAEKSAAPRRKVLFSLSALSIGQAWPSGVGGGFMYQDKRNRLFGGKGYVTNIGTIYTAEVLMPLSFKGR